MVLLVGACKETREDTGQACGPASGDLPGNHGGHGRVVCQTTHEATALFSNAGTAELRMGSHSLPHLTGSWAGIPCDQRVCSLCGSHSPGERHVVFECPALQHLRAEHGSLFQRRFSMRKSMWQPGAVQVAKFVAACLKEMSVGA